MVFYTICMLGYHVKADRNQSFADESGMHDKTFISFWDRIQAGPNALTTLDKILFGALILMAFELLDYISGHVGKWIHAKLIPVRGKHLDELSGKDILFVGLNKAATAPFVYFVLRYAYFEPNVVWYLRDMSLVREMRAVVAHLRKGSFSLVDIHSIPSLDAVDECSATTASSICSF